MRIAEGHRFGNHKLYDGGVRFADAVARRRRRSGRCLSEVVDEDGEIAMPHVGPNVRWCTERSKFAWTPMRIAEGHRFGNHKPSDVTMAAAALRTRSPGEG